MHVRSLRAWVSIPRLILLGLLVLYTAVFAKLAFDLHTGMRTHKADLGQIAQAVWNSSRGRFVEMTDNGFVATRMTDHVEPILALISPVLWLWDDVRALLLLQAIFAAVGALLLYALARRLLAASVPERSSQWLALTLVGAYLLSPQLQSALLTEFHAAPLAVPLIFWAFWAVAAQRWRQFALAALLVAGVKEEMALLAAGLGVWAFYQALITRGAAAPTNENGRGARPLLLASLVIVGALAWFYVATFVIVPAHAADVYGVAESSYFQRYGELGDSPVDIATSLFRRPGAVWSVASEPARVQYLVNLLMGFGFLSLLAPEILLLALPLLLANLLSAYPAQYYGEFHYSAPLVPYFAVSAAYGLRRSHNGLMRLVNALPAPRIPTQVGVTALLMVWLIFWSLFLYVQAGRAPLGGRYDPTPITAHHQLLDRFLPQIPPDAAVTATAAVHPHVALRRYVYQFPTGLDAPQPATWALLDVTTNTDMAPGDLKSTVEQMLATDWGIVDGADGFLLLRRGAAEKTIPDAFYDFARGEDRAEGTTDGSGALQLLDVDVDDWPRWRQTRLISDWRVGGDFVPGTVRPWLEVRTPGGDTLYDFAVSTPPALLWYPPERWQAGEVIRVTTLPLHLPRFWGVAVDRNAASSAPNALVDRHEALQLVAAYEREDQGTLQALSPTAFAPLETTTDGLEVRGEFDVTTAGDDASTIQLRAVVDEPEIWPGETVQLWLEWGEAERWPEHLRPFVHLRRGDDNQSQSDGEPRWFVYYPVDALLEGQERAPDWRQLHVPEEAFTALAAENASEPWQIAIGLYDPESGERAPRMDGADLSAVDELVLGPLGVTAPPVPDQACALLPATCAAQPVQR